MISVSMVLIHDLVEIDAGDTYAYDTAGAQTQRERELKGGSAEAMLAFARKLAGKYGLREEQRSKFARARALAAAR